MRVTIDKGTAVKALRELEAFAMSKYEALAKKANTLSDEAKKNHVGVSVLSPREACMREAIDWAQDANSARVLATAYESAPYDTVRVDFDVVRWMYKHTAPDLVQSSIGRFPG